MITRVTQTEEYSKLIDAQGISFMQSWEWGEVKGNVKRLLLSNLPISIFIKKIPGLNKSFGYIPRSFSNTSVDLNNLKELVKYSKDVLGLTHLVVEPNIINESKIEIFKEAGFFSSGKTIQPNRTNIIDLSKSEDDLWMDLRAAFRRSIKKCIKNECSVEMYEDGEEALNRFYKIMSVIVKKTKFSSYDYGYYKKVWDIFSLVRKARIYIVTSRGNDVGAYFLLYDNIFAYELYGGVNDEGKTIKAGHLMKWETIKDAKKMKKNFYDQWGVAKRIEGEYLKNDELYYISIFKEGFGGKYIEFLPQQTIVFNKAGYFLYSIGQKLNKLKIIFRKRL